MSSAAPSTLALRADELAATCPLTDWDGDPQQCRWCCAWLGTRSKATFCAPLCSVTFWSNHSWKAAKDAVKKRAKRRCETCGAPSRATTQVHHLGGAVAGGRTRLASCDHHLDALRLECWTCHQAEHHGEREAG